MVKSEIKGENHPIPMTINKRPNGGKKEEERV
jgi:hypothetical protein